MYYNTDPMRNIKMKLKTFKTKLRRIGNSQGVYIPTDVITGYKIGNVITLTLEEEVITEKPVEPKEVITPKAEEVYTANKDTVESPKTGKWNFNQTTGTYENNTKDKKHI